MPPPRSAPEARPSTGRARNEQARRAILDAALDLARQDLSTVTVDAIAARAGVGKATIYRWWPSKSAVVLDALIDQAEQVVPGERSGDVRRDVVRFLTASFTALTGPHGTGPLLRVLMAQAQLDPLFARSWREHFIQPRRGALIHLLTPALERGELQPGLDVQTAADVIFGGLWYRLLLGHAPLNDVYADQLAASVLA